MNYENYYYFYSEEIAFIAIYSIECTCNKTKRRKKKKKEKEKGNKKKREGKIDIEKK